MQYLESDLILSAETEGLTWQGNHPEMTQDKNLKSKQLQKRQEIWLGFPWLGTIGMVCDGPMWRPAYSRSAYIPCEAMFATMLRDVSRGRYGSGESILRRPEAAMSDQRRAWKTSFATMSACLRFSTKVGRIPLLHDFQIGIDGEDHSEFPTSASIPGCAPMGSRAGKFPHPCVQ